MNGGLQQAERIRTATEAELFTAFGEAALNGISYVLLAADDRRFASLESQFHDTFGHPPVTTGER